jgi:hypothetical protein
MIIDEMVDCETHQLISPIKISDVITIDLISFYDFREFRLNVDHIINPESKPWMVATIEMSIE